MTHARTPRRSEAEAAAERSPAAGSPFKGEESQYKWLGRLAQEVFGGSMTSRVVRVLVDAFLKVPGGGKL